MMGAFYGGIITLFLNIASMILIAMGAVYLYQYNYSHDLQNRGKRKWRRVAQLLVGVGSVVNFIGLVVWSIALVVMSQSVGALSQFVMLKSYAVPHEGWILGLFNLLVMLGILSSYKTWRSASAETAQQERRADRQFYKTYGVYPRKAPLHASDFENESDLAAGGAGEDSDYGMKKSFVSSYHDVYADRTPTRSPSGGVGSIGNMPSHFRTPGRKGSGDKAMNLMPPLGISSSTVSDSLLDSDSLDTDSLDTDSLLTDSSEESIIRRYEEARRKSLVGSNTGNGHLALNMTPNGPGYSSGIPRRSSRSYASSGGYMAGGSSGGRPSSSASGGSANYHSTMHNVSPPQQMYGIPSRLSTGPPLVGSGGGPVTSSSSTTARLSGTATGGGSSGPSSSFQNNSTATRSNGVVTGSLHHHQRQPHQSVVAPPSSSSSSSSSSNSTRNPTRQYVKGGESANGSLVNLNSGVIRSSSSQGLAPPPAQQSTYANKHGPISASTISTAPGGSFVGSGGSSHSVTASRSTFGGAGGSLAGAAVIAGGGGGGTNRLSQVRL